MITRETTKGLAPRSWIGVAVWAVIVAAAIQNPGGTLSFLYRSASGTGQWIGYHAFAQCGDQPPHDWMTSKPCEPENLDTSDTDDDIELGPPEVIPPPLEGEAGDGYVIQLDGNSIRGVLDQGTELVFALHSEVEAVQDNGGLTVEIGDQP